MTQEIKEKIKERYGKIAVSGDSDCCCMPDDCCSSESSPKQALISIGYNEKELADIPDSSKLGVGCGAPLNFANLKEGETVVDLGSGAGIDAFLASKQVKDAGKVIGIDFTDEMLNKATSAAKEHGFKEIHRILKNKGRIAISDLVTSKEVHGESVSADKWCSCIDGALTKENYINSIKEAGFKDVNVLNEQVYMNEDKTDGRKITSIVIGAVT